MTEMRDWSHSCTKCSWTGWGPPPINQNAHHQNPDGGTCPGPIQTDPPPHAEDAAGRRKGSSQTTDPLPSDRTAT